MTWQPAQLRYLSELFQAQRDADQLYTKGELTTEEYKQSCADIALLTERELFRRN